MSDLTWYINRLKTMSVREVGFRLIRLTWGMVENLNWVQSHKTQSIKKIEILPSTLNERLRDIFPWNSEKEFFTKLFIKEETKTIQNNNNASPFPVFEERVDLTKPIINWHRDPKNGNSWPLINSESIDIRDAKNIGEVDYVWRVNRCQHLIDLAQSSYILNDFQLRNIVLDQIVDWIKSNPYRKGVNWTSAMEIAIRCISWVTALSYLVQDENIPTQMTPTICNSILLQMDYVYHHLSRYSSANNHLIVELTGLFTIGLIFKGTTRGQKWLQQSIKELETEVQRQVYPDGAAKEQSTHYHSLVLDCLLWVIVLARREEIALPENIKKRAESMCDFIAAIMDTNGNVPSIGDSDDGYAIWLTDLSKENNYRSQLATGTVLFNRPDFKNVAGHFDKKSFWLLGKTGFNLFQEISPTSKTFESRAFNDSGYYVFKSEGDKSENLLLFDCGPLGYPSTAAHGHADALSIWLSIGGQPILIDPGTFSYLLYPKWRNYFRSTAAHNTAVINDSNQSEIGGPYIWVNQAQSRCEAWHTSPSFDYAVGRHDGYYKRFGAIHLRRILFFKPDFWLIEDEFECDTNIDIQTFFHFSPGKPIIETTETHHVCDFTELSGRSGIQIIVPDRNRLKVGIAQGNNSTMKGWISQRYGQKIESSVLTIASKGSGQNRFCYLLFPKFCKYPDDVHKASSSFYSLSVNQKNGYELITFDKNKNQHDIYIVNDPNLTMQIGELELIAQTICVRSNSKGIIESIFIIAPSTILCEGKKYRFDSSSIAYAIIQSTDQSNKVLNIEPLGLNHSLEKTFQSNIVFLGK
jgi:hypothetical protein